MNTMPTPAFLLAPEDQPAELLFLLLHGVGGDGHQMRALADALRAQYPRAAVLALDGPEPFDAIPGGGSGHQWFSLRGLDDASRIERVAAALPGFIAEVRRWAAQFELPWERVALAGFSQGGIMALEAVQAEPQLAGRVLAFGSRYATLPSHAPQDVCLHLLHGMADDVLPHGDIVQAAQALVQLGADVTADVRPGIGHSLHPELIARAMEQLRTFVPARLWREAVLAAAEQDRAQPTAGS